MVDMKAFETARWMYKQGYNLAIRGSQQWPSRYMIDLLHYTYEVGVLFTTSH